MRRASRTAVPATASAVAWQYNRWTAATADAAAGGNVCFCCCCRSAGGGLSSATVSDLQELRTLLLDAKAENEQLKSERDQVGDKAHVTDV